MKKVIYASINVNKAEIGETYTLSSNLTVRYLFDATTGQHVEGAIGEYYRWADEIVEEINKASGGNISISKNKTTLKLCPGTNLTVVKKLSYRGKPSLLMEIGQSGYAIILDPYNDLGKMELTGTPAKGLKVESDEMWAAYMVPDIYGRHDTKWKWTEKDYDETEKQFKARVARQAKNLAERSFSEYDPRSIKKKFFKSKDAFIKFCDTVGLKPRFED